MSPSELTMIPVPATVKKGKATVVTSEEESTPPGLVVADPPGPAGPGPRPLAEYQPFTDATNEAPTKQVYTCPDPDFEICFDTTDYLTNAAHTGGWVFIPPDPSAAAGQDHLINVVNTAVRFHDKDGTLQFDDSLKNFFAALPEPSPDPDPGSSFPHTYTFDPKVIYDQFEDRFVIVTLERTDTSAGDPANSSYILLAVSETGDPTPDEGSWYLTYFDAKLTDLECTGSAGTTEHWADYPGFAVDDAAVYITTTSFPFGGIYSQCSRQWVVDKGAGAGGFYDGGAVSVTEFDLIGDNGWYSGTLQPAHIFGNSPFITEPGTYFVSYSGLSDGTYEYLQVINLNDPLGTPTSGWRIRYLGNIDDTLTALPDAGQSGGTRDIEVNDRRALHTVWRDNHLWVSTTVKPGTGSDADETTAYWIDLNASGTTVSVQDQGAVGDIPGATGAFTFFPAIGVNEDGDMALGFSASESSIYAGAYLAYREFDDAEGTTRTAETVHAGEDYYYRNFGGSRNRWGDYTGLAVDPVTECFWVYNEYAMIKDADPPAQGGRWATAFALRCPCSESTSLTQNYWEMISSPCDLGGADTVAKAFGGELDTVDYDSTWSVWERDAANEAYVKLDLTDTIEEGTGYWITTSEAGNTVKLEGSRNVGVDTALESDADYGRPNLAGHPYPYNVCWADVTVVDGASTLSLDEADPVIVSERACDMDPPHEDCIMSRVGHKWTGTAYEAFDGGTPLLNGELTPFDGVWVKAFKSGISLQVPAVESCAAARDPVNVQGVAVRLVARAGALEDSSNALGRLNDSLDDYDHHDLEELAPFGSTYMTIVFPHLDWGDHASDLFTSDYRELRAGAGGSWDFEIRSDSARQVNLSWQAWGSHAANFMAQALLHDLENGTTTAPANVESLTVNVLPGSHRFRWTVNALPLVDAAGGLEISETGLAQLVV
ncbi:MAG: hypothetical protein GY906_05685, partial [bacterium]|nr:hypothetical protein [bacterium]